MQSPIAHHSTRSPRRAFTLIELLIVIALIGMLAAILLGPVLGIFGSARTTQVVAEIGNLDKGIQDFKLRLGVEPPSFIRLYESPMGWTANATSPVVRQSRAFLMRAWPDFDFTVPHDINVDGDATDVVNLQSTESLVFFLGGHQMLSATNPQPLGFSVNPTNPFVTGGQRIGPYYTFDIARLIDVDNDGFPEYLDPIPGQVLPYLYFSSYEGAGYRPWGGDTDGDMNIIGDADDEILQQGGSDLIDGLYMVNDQQWPTMMGMGGGRPVAAASEYINPKTFQIISPGQDFQFGAGGTYIRGSGLATYSGMDTYRTRDARKAEFDNITNFSGGLIGETTIDKPAT